MKLSKIAKRILKEALDEYPEIDTSNVDYVYKTIIDNLKVVDAAKVFPSYATEQIRSELRNAKWDSEHGDITRDEYARIAAGVYNKTKNLLSGFERYKKYKQQNPNLKLESFLLWESGENEYDAQMKRLMRYLEFIKNLYERSERDYWKHVNKNPGSADRYDPVADKLSRRTHQLFKFIDRIEDIMQRPDYAEDGTKLDDREERLNLEKLFGRLMRMN